MPQADPTVFSHKRTLQPQFRDLTLRLLKSINTPDYDNDQFGRRERTTHRFRKSF